MTFEELKKGYLEGSKNLKEYELKLNEFGLDLLNVKEKIDDEDYESEEDRDSLLNKVENISQSLAVVYKGYWESIVNCWNTMPESEKILATKAYPPGTGVKKDIAYSSNGLGKFLYDFSMKASRNTLDLSVAFWKTL